MKILILEDDKQDKKLLIDYLHQYFEQKHILDVHIDAYSDKHAVCTNLYLYDLCFIDIEIGNDNGIDYAIQIRKENKAAKIIFVSNYKKYLIDGYKASANRYFLKPIDKQEFFIELDSLLHDYHLSGLHFFDKKIYPQKIFYHEIVYIEAILRKTYIHTSSKAPIETPISLRAWIEKLSPYYFAQPYKSLLINLNKVRFIEESSLTLSDDTILPISRHFKESFSHAFLKNLQERF